VLREVKNPTFPRRLTLFGWRYEFVLGSKPTGMSWRTKRFRAVRTAQRREPTGLMREGDRVYWAFEDRYYWEDEGLTPTDVLALVRDRQRRRQRKLEHAHASLAADRLEFPRRDPIPRAVRLAVFQRDGGRCVACDSNFDIQYDHVIPVAMGGASTLENLQILCADCNRRKGATLG
jgi:5-methylcytosine-specific restriction endonuclease McrA